MDISWHGQFIQCTVPLNVYSLDVIHKCFYWYGNDFSVDVEVLNSSFAVVKLIPKTKCQTNFSIDQLSEKIRNDLIDSRTRDIVTKETRNIRDLLVAKAFAPVEDLTTGTEDDSGNR